jgi:hypothetical protein
MVENLCANPSASIRFIYHHLVHLANKCLAPQQVALNSESAKANSPLVTYGTKIYLPVSGERKAKQVPK